MMIGNTDFISVFKKYRVIPVRKEEPYEIDGNGSI